MVLCKRRRLTRCTKSTLLLYTACLVTVWFISMYTGVRQLNERPNLSEDSNVLQKGHFKKNLPDESPVHSLDPEAKRLLTEVKEGFAKVSKANAFGCTEWYKDTFAENLRVISEYPRGNVSHMLSQIKRSRNTTSRIMTSFPVIVTAANSAFYGISQGLLKSIHQFVLPTYRDVKIVYYDLGLGQAQSEELKKYCKCEVRPFRFDDYPPHVRQLKTYAWKPIIMQTMLMEYGWVWWMDSSVRFVTSDLDRALQYSTQNHVLFLTYGPELSVAYNTDNQTMQYLQEDPCKFRSFGEIEATFALFHYSDVTSVLVEAWCACALTEKCIAPPGTSMKLGCNANKKFDGRCHRFDQSVLSILLRRLYHEQNDYPLVDVPFHIHQIRRGNIVNYFKDLINPQREKVLS